MRWAKCQNKYRNQIKIVSRSTKCGFTKSNCRSDKESNPFGKVSKHNLKSNQPRAMAYKRISTARYSEQSMEIIMGILSIIDLQLHELGLISNCVMTPYPKDLTPCPIGNLI